MKCMNVMKRYSYLYSESLKVKRKFLQFRQKWYHLFSSIFQKRVKNFYTQSGQSECANLQTSDCKFLLSVFLFSFFFPSLFSKILRRSNFARLQPYQPCGKSNPVQFFNIFSSIFQNLDRYPTWLFNKSVEWKYSVRIHFYILLFLFS